MAKMIATKAFAGSSLNRDDLGRVEVGTVVDVSENDARQLELHGEAERYVEPAPEETAASQETEQSPSSSEATDREPATKPDDTT